MPVHCTCTVKVSPMFINPEWNIVASIPRRQKLWLWTSKISRRNYYQPSRWLSTWCQAPKYLDCIQNIFDKHLPPFPMGLLASRRPRRGFFVERCYLYHFNHSCILWSSFQRHWKTVMHATWIISIFRKPLILFHLMGFLTPRQQELLMEPWEKMRNWLENKTKCWKWNRMENR